MPLASAAAPPDGILQFRSPVEVDRPSVLLSDLADLAQLPEPIRDRTVRLVVLTLAPQLSTTHVDARRLAESARRQMPILAPWLADVSERKIGIALRSSVALEMSTVGRSSCVELLRDLDAGLAPTPNSFHAVACDDRESARAWRYDVATHIARAVRPLHAGEIVAEPLRQRIASVQRGEIVTQRVQVGTTTVVRQGVSLFDSAENRLATVRTASGETAMWHPAPDMRGH
ncbi:hypothetical protein [Burkholderia sp. PU8-34]